METVGHNKIAINFVWTLLAGFLVMFMQAGFAMVETGFTRAKNAAHTMSMNFMIYPIGMLGFWICGYALQMGGVGAVAALGGTAPLNHEFTVTLFGHPFGLFGLKGFFLSGGTLRRRRLRAVPVPDGLHGHGGDDSDRRDGRALEVFGVHRLRVLHVDGRLPDLRATGCGVAAGCRSWVRSFGLGHGHVDFAGSSVVHLVGGVAALAGAIVIGPRIGKYTKTGESMPMPGHDLPMALAGTFILAFGWFGFNPGLDAGRQRPADRRGRDQHDAGRHGRRGRGDVLRVEAARQAGSEHVVQRPARRAGRDHRAVRVRQLRVGGDHRRDRRRARRRSRCSSSSAC